MEEGKRGKCFQDNKYIDASHLLVLSSVSSKKLQALPCDPLILVTSHKISVFYHTAGSGTLIFMVPCEGCKWLKADWNSPLLFTFPQLLPCTVSTLAALDEVTLSCSLPFFSLLVSALWSCSSLYLPSLCPLSFLDGSFHPLSPSGLILSFLWFFLPPPTLSRPLLLPRQQHKAG